MSTDTAAPRHLHADTPLRIVYCGMTGAFSVPPLEALLAAGHTICAVVLALPGGLALPGAPSEEAPPFSWRAAAAARVARPRPLLTPALSRSILTVAAERGLPVLDVRRLSDPRTLAALTELAPDAICVACFPRRLPASWLRLPRLGCLNVHPSLLPENRGPDPLFWTFYRGDATTGVSIHLMAEGLDSGPLLVQQPLAVAGGITEAQLERRCAEVGGDLLAYALRELAAGTLRPIPQDETRATAYPWPSEEHYRIPAQRPARWAYTFACGVVARSTPLLIHLSGEPDMLVRVLAALEYDDEGVQPMPWRIEGDRLWLQCAPGIFQARVARIE